MNLLATLSARRDRAIQAISDSLRGRPEFRRLPRDQGADESEVVEWSVELEAAGTTWETYVLLTTSFPDEPPRVRVPQAADLVLKNPHVLEKGDLCTIPDCSSIDSNDPSDCFSM